MVRGILADVNLEGHFEALVNQILRGSEWKEYWDSLRLTVESFETLELDKATPDRVLWRLCQERSLLLVTANRNRSGKDSLEETIAGELTAMSLPVLTISDARRFRDSREYAMRVAVRLMEIVTDIAVYSGTGREYLP